MPAWDYTLFSQDHPFNATSFKEHGDRGFELVSVVHDPDGGQWIAFFKRPRPDDKQPPAKQSRA